MSLHERLSQHVDTIADELKALSQQLYAHPEIAFQEYQACQWISALLERHGFIVERGAGGLATAFYAHLPGRVSAPKIALLAEYDALPKIGHGCGHNLIAAASVGAALALSANRDDLTGSVVVVGTPAEEGGGGKILLLEAGIFDDVSAALMFHPGSRTVVGYNSFGRLKFTVEFFGQAAHAAACPEEGINALDAMIAFFNNMGLLRQQLRDETRVHGIITHGGDAVNVIPDYTAALVYVRSFEMSYLETLYAKVVQCAEGAALATGARVTITPDPMRYAPRKRSAALEALCQQHLEALGFTIEDAPPLKIGSTDLGNLSQKIPAIHPTIAIVTDRTIPGHSREMAAATMTPLGQERMLLAAKMLAWTACDFLASPDLQARVAHEFAAAP